MIKSNTLKIVFILNLAMACFVSSSSTNTSSKVMPLSLQTKMEQQSSKYGILGEKAPELSNNIEWIDGNGKEMEPILLSDYAGKFKVIYGFQSWCPGCHSRGLPALQKMVKTFTGNDDIVFFAIQTVFEGFHTNTKEKLSETQDKYKLPIPFGHDVGNETTGNRSSTMSSYKTGGTPWFIFIDQNDQVVFNDFHLDVEKTIAYLNEHLAK